MNIALNLDTWSRQREMNFCPHHFVRAQTPLKDESRLWVLEKLHGRFFVADNDSDDLFVVYSIIYFEDPQEAVFYELTWS